MLLDFKLHYKVTDIKAVCTGIVIKNKKQTFYGAGQWHTQ